MVLNITPTKGFTRRFFHGREESAGWERAETPTCPAGVDPNAGHGGTDMGMAQAFVRAMLNGKEMPIDVYRMCDYSLPGILANESAKLGGQPVEVPDIRRKPFTGTEFWNHIPLPEDEPEVCKYHPAEFGFAPPKIDE